jgi:polyhydroxyalkanoate synthase
MGKPTDWEELANNLARMVEQGGKALAAYLKPREEGRKETDHAEFIDMVKTLGQVAEYWLTDPQRTFELQSSLSSYGRMPRGA